MAINDQYSETPAPAKALSEKAPVDLPPKVPRAPLTAPIIPMNKRYASTGYPEKQSISTVDFQMTEGDSQLRPTLAATRSPSYRNRLTSFSESYVQARNLISAILKDPGQTTQVALLQGKDAQTIVDFLNTVSYYLTVGIVWGFSRES